MTLCIAGSAVNLKSDFADEFAERGQPLCPIFGQCGGCQFQDIPYQVELAKKEEVIRHYLTEKSQVPLQNIFPIVPSPKKYHYRCRLDLKLLKLKSGEVLVGFSPKGKNRIIPSDSCAIAMEAVSLFLPELKRQAMARLPIQYRNANLVIKTGDDGRVSWGGIGRRSLQMSADDYFWTMVGTRKVYYSLDTFFQANLAIVPLVLSRLQELVPRDPGLTFYDFYGGVGLFSVGMAEHVGNIVLVEENIHSCRLARYNFERSGLAHTTVIEGRLEHYLPVLQASPLFPRNCVLIDPPRQGLSREVASMLAEDERLTHIFYLSCHPETLARDINILWSRGWEVSAVIPFDFFPRTEHIETLVELKRGRTSFV